MMMPMVRHSKEGFEVSRNNRRDKKKKKPQTRRGTAAAHSKDAPNDSSFGEIL